MDDVSQTCVYFEEGHEVLTIDSALYLIGDDSGSSPRPSCMAITLINLLDSTQSLLQQSSGNVHNHTFPPAPMLGSLPRSFTNVSNRRLVRLVSKKAIQDRDDFNILLFASFWLCFNAGMVNLISLSSYLNIATAHVTGLVARASTAIADGNWGYLFLPATTFLSFLLGSIFGGLTISHDSFYLGRSFWREEECVG